jgi:hypothetical protein
MDSNETREDKVEKPHAHFGDPQDVVADPALSKEEKVEALETLEQDARLLTTAAQEGMTGGEENKLQEVLDAKKALEERDDAPNLQTIPRQARTQKWPKRQRLRSLILEPHIHFRRAIHGR